MSRTEAAITRPAGAEERGGSGGRVPMSAARQTGGLRWGVAVIVAFSIRSGCVSGSPHVLFDPQDATVLPGHPVTVTAMLLKSLVTAGPDGAYVRVTLSVLNPRLAIEPAVLYWNASVDDWGTTLRQFTVSALVGEPDVYDAVVATVESNSNEYANPVAPLRIGVAAAYSPPPLPPPPSPPPPLPRLPLALRALARGLRFRVVGAEAARCSGGGSGGALSGLACACANERLRRPRPRVRGARMAAATHSLRAEWGWKPSPMVTSHTLSSPLSTAMAYAEYMFAMGSW